MLSPLKIQASFVKIVTIDLIDWCYNNVLKLLFRVGIPGSINNTLPQGLILMSWPVCQWLMSDTVEEQQVQCRK